MVSTTVMSQEKRQVIIAWRDIALAVPLYSNASREAYYAEDMLPLDSMIDIMNEVFCSESDITDKGKQFLEEFFGFESLANILINNKRFYYLSNAIQLTESLKNLVPHEIGAFITEARKFNLDK